VGLEKVGAILARNNYTPGLPACGGNQISACNGDAPGEQG
jgi:hypothetical protein